MSSHTPIKSVIVCGGGVIGSAIAYFLSLKGVGATIIERTEIAGAASGKAGGFLALDWCDRSPLSELARASFALHADLAKTLGTEHNYGYRRLDTYSLVVSENAPPKGPSSALPEWIDGSVVGKPGVLGSTETTAQVHPYLFTTALQTAACKNGAKVIKGTVENIQFVESDGKKRVSGVVVDGKTLSADIVVVALGPWSYLASSWFPSLPRIRAHKAHSIVLRPTSPIGPHALFLSYKTKQGKTLDPEVYPRPTGEVYICGMGEDVPLPATSADVTPRAEACEQLVRVAATVSSRLAGAAVERTQACFLPIPPDGLPLIGAIPGVVGAYVATGHSCWGILNAPATGAAMAELIVDGNASIVDLSPYSPQRFLNYEEDEED